MKIRFYCGDCAKYTCCPFKKEKQGKICEEFRPGWRFYETEYFAISVSPRPYDSIHSSYDLEVENQFDTFIGEPITLTTNNLGQNG